MRRLTLRRFSIPKCGNDPHECEDKANLHSRRTLHRGDFRIAVSDGATNAAWSREWGAILTKHFVQHPFPIPRGEDGSTSDADSQLREPMGTLPESIAALHLSRVPETLSVAQRAALKNWLVEAQNEWLQTVRDGLQLPVRPYVL